MANKCDCPNHLGFGRRDCQECAMLDAEESDGPDPHDEQVEWEMLKGGEDADKGE